MVAPLAAAAGKMMMGTGSKLAGTAATRSMAGRGLSTGSMMDTKTAKGFDKITKNTDLMVKGITITNKTLNSLAKSSPALSQQMIILRKSFGLFLRPIGDIMARFLRPAAVWLMKVAKRWYSLWGKGNADTGTNHVLRDEIKQLQTEQETALAAGNIDLVKEIQDQIRGKLLQIEDNKSVEAPAWLEQVWSDVANVAEAVGGIFKGTSGGEPEPPAAGDKIDWAGDLYDGYIAPGMEGAKKWGDELYSTKLDPGMEGAKVWGSTIYNENIAPGMAGAKKWCDVMYEDNIEPGIKGSKLWGSTIYRDYISKGWESAKNWANDVWALIRSAVRNIISKDKPKDTEESTARDKANEGARTIINASKAIGGSVESTGLYNLHAGERVVTAADVSRANNRTTTVNNVFNISATINNEMDIEHLARRLADLNETELRRRVSYI